MKKLKFFISKLFLFNVLGGIVFIFAVFFGLVKGLDVYTNRGEAISVPDFTGHNLISAERLAMSKNLFVFVDDSVFNSDYQPGIILDQYPKPEQKVKKQRVITLIVNSSEPEKVAVPNLLGVSVRQANADAEVFGFKIGNLSYIPDISTTVIHMSHKGQRINPGTLINKGELIDLTVGMGTSRDKAIIPRITGLSFADAEERLMANYLNIGAVAYDKTVKSKADSANARIWKQFPRPSKDVEVALGSYVDIWLTIDKDLIPEAEKKSDENIYENLENI